MHDVGAGWLMTSLAPSALMVALVQAAASLPVFLLALPAGAIADSVDRRRYLIGTMLWSATGATGLAAATLAGVATPGILLTGTAAIGIGTALTMPAWAALVPEVVPRPQLLAAIALSSLGINLARAVGPALAGFVISATDPGVVFLLNALSFLGIVAVLLRWRRETSPPTLPAERFAAALRAGLRYVRHAAPLRATMVRGGTFFLFASSTWALLPLLARNELAGDPALYGTLLAAVGLGAVGGAMVLPRLRARLDRDRLVGVATVLFAASSLGMAWARALPGVVAAMLALGAAWITVLSSLQVAAQVSLPAWVRARGLAANMTVFMGSMAVGSALWGRLADATGIPLALSLAAAGALLAAAATRSWRIASDGGDLAPSLHWPSPLVDPDAPTDRGPVMVTVDYRIPADQAEAFVAAMREVRTQRLRDGASTWHLFRDAEDTERFVESFMVESWLEHLRQHERVTHADRDVEERVRAFHKGEHPPRVKHLIAAYPWRQ